jgi:PAS domain S-box-containing protein
MKPISVSNRKAQLAFRFAILTLLAVGAISYRSMLVSSESGRWVRHTHDVLENAEDLLSAVQSVELSYRGFAFTGNESFLESYRASASSAHRDLATLRELTADNPVQQQRIRVLEALINRKIQLAETTIGLRMAKGLDTRPDAPQYVVGQRIMDELQSAIREFKDEELRLLVIRRADTNRRLLQSRLALFLGIGLGVLIAAAAGWSVQRDSSERDLAEKKLRENEEHCRTLLDEVQDYAMFMLDPQGTVVTWNAGAERIKGYKANDIIGHNYSCFFPPEDIKRGRPEELLRKTAASGRYEYQGMRVRQNGSRFLASVIFISMKDPDGTLRGFYEISRDLSETKEAGAKYRGLLEAAPDAMVVVNQGGEMVLLNVQAEKQFGYHRDELVGQPVTVIIPEGFAERLIADDLRSTAEALEQQIGTGIELTGRRKDGTEFPLELMLSPLESAEGILVTAAIRNISVRKDAEKHLAQMEGRYRGLLEAAPDAMVVVSQAGNIVLLNVQAEKQFGYSRDELVGQKVTNIIPEGFAERLIADDLRSAADALAQQIGTGIELIARRKNRTEFPIEIMLSPLESAEGTLVTAAIRNITERKKAEQHLVKTVGELKRSNDELEQFAYVASHDLQEPLRMVASYTQLLAQRYKGQLDSDADEFIAYAVDGSTRMQGLIQDLLAYSRAGANGKELHEVSSGDALKEALTNLRGTIKENRAVVTHGPLPAITTDSMQLVQVFQNLIGNAIKYHSARLPLVHVSAAKNGGGEWIFSVRDNGLGIEPQYFERIFVLFQRLHGREEFKGTGIGLAVCKKMVEQLGGRIWLESQPGEGSTFHFALPELGSY